MTLWYVKSQDSDKVALCPMLVIDGTADVTHAGVSILDSLLWSSESIMNPIQPTRDTGKPTGQEGGTDECSPVLGHVYVGRLLYG